MDPNPNSLAFSHSRLIVHPRLNPRSLVLPLSEVSTVEKKAIPWHEHELTLHGEGKNTEPITDAYQSKSCRACGLPIFTTPTYICLVCKFFIHAKCADLARSTNPDDQNRQQLQIDSKMELKADIPVGYESIDCEACGRKPDPKSFCVIKAEAKATKSFVHFFCAFSLDIRIRHRSHRHDLIALRGKSYSFQCGGCGKEHARSAAAEGDDDNDVPVGKVDNNNGRTAEKKEDQVSAARKEYDKAKAAASSSGDRYYVCNICGYWLHEECSSLPAVIRHEDHKGHTLRLTFAVSRGSSPVCKWSCELPSCNKETIAASSQAYFCSKCDIYAHITCATKDKQRYKEDSPENESDPDVYYLPLPDDHQSCIEHCLNKPTKKNKFDSSTVSEDQTGKNEILIKQELHEHELILTIDHQNEDHVCNACVQPIYSSEQHYRCSSSCAKFFLHAACAELLPPSLKHPAYDDTLELFKRPSSDKLLSLFTCSCCGRKCNGFAYGCRGSNVYLDVICASLPNLIMHEAHSPFHVLALRHSAATKYSNTSAAWFYNCRSCPFALHAKCALLPKTVHIAPEFDEHPLQLVTSVVDYERYSSDEHFCEVCEGKIDFSGGFTRNKWYYRCQDNCDQSFHVECVPSVSPVLSRVRFGDGIRVNCHGCDVVSVRMLTVGSHRCGDCKKIVQGRKDEIAFRCSTCDFWMHYECAEKRHVAKSDGD